MAERESRIMVVCRPAAAYFGAGDLARHNLTAPADRRRALAQHRRLRAVLAAAGWDVATLAEPASHPNAVFTRDPVACLRGGFLRLRMGLPSRRGEEEWLAAELVRLGMEELGRVEAPGTAEGGDVVPAGRTVFIGRSSRTNAAGARQLRDILTHLGHEVRIAPVPPPCLHLGGVMTVIGEGRVLAVTRDLPAGFLDGFDVVGVPAGSFVSGNVIPLGEGLVLAERTNRAAVEALRAAGVCVRTLDLSEFLKGTGGPSCLVQPVPAARPFPAPRQAH